MLKIMDTKKPDLLNLYFYQATLVIPRLERITPDSSWAHRATGLRRTLLRLTHEASPNPRQLHAILREGFQLLEKAAKDKVR